MKRTHKTFSVLALVAMSLALGPASWAQAAPATKQHAHKVKARLPPHLRPLALPNPPKRGSAIRFFRW